MEHTMAAQSSSDHAVPPPSALERAMLALTVAGFIIPNTMVAAYFLGEGASLRGYFGHWFASLPSSQLFADLAIVTAAFWIWSYVDHKRADTRGWWAIPAATLLVGICMAVPLHLWLREMQLRRRVPVAHDTR
jgi:hypothetical protein